MRKKEHTITSCRLIKLGRSKTLQQLTITIFNNQRMNNPMFSRHPSLKIISISLAISTSKHHSIITKTCRPDGKNIAKIILPLSIIYNNLSMSRPIFVLINRHTSTWKISPINFPQYIQQLTLTIMIE